MANKTTTIQIRVDEDLKRQATKVLGQMHITMSEAIKMFLGQIAHRKRLPLDVFVPNEETLRAMDEVDRDEDMYEASSVEEFMKALER
ncbi:MAG: type II toxin-antitoxin system RelB/DinJ family antitoxin [Phycisphaerae bacterium]|nr:type II toxin-antitoxin system RelB/DinJ family antitoxin [Phycisphaerae bacterium]